MTIELAHTFAVAAQHASHERDLPTAIASINNLLCCRDLPIGYRQDAEEIMDLLIRDYFKVQR